MPSSRTQITEIATALGMTGAPSLDTAFDQPGPPVVGVSADRWRQLHALYRAGAHLIDFEGAWRNGRAFRDATWGLRGRPPLRIEWKGPHKPPAYEFLPADLRVDHVFLVSCKHDSHILANTSP
ncbi:MAG: hypothetical protein HYU28_10495, partial [Actinobacteria bacterium]|nr:hypothetical protein [Actinomycetota bacterium]